MKLASGSVTAYIGKNEVQLKMLHILPSIFDFKKS